MHASAADLVALSIGPPYGDTFQTDTFAVTVDGVELTKPLQELARGPMPPSVSVLAGSNLDEGTEFMQLTPTIPCNASLAALSSWAVRQFGDELGSQIAPLYNAPEAPAPQCSYEWRGVTSPHWVGAMRAAGDAAIGCRCRELLRAVNTGAAKSSSNSKPATGWRYLFTISPQFSVNWPNSSLPYAGSFHGAEVPFVFGDQFELTTPEERGASRAMGCWWLNFVRGRV
jgi:carboxylesterase type B